MKRYLCEKDFVMESGYIAFKAGKVYSTPSTHFPLRFASEGMSYAGHSMSEDNMKGFRELEPIDDELYENPMEDWHPMSHMEERQIPVWARIAVAVFISAILLFLIATL